MLYCKKAEVLSDDDGNEYRIHAKNQEAWYRRRGEQAIRLSSVSFLAGLFAFSLLWCEEKKRRKKEKEIE